MNSSEEVIIKVCPSLLTSSLHQSHCPKKIANSGSSSSQLAFALPFDNVASSGTLQLLTGPETASNTPEAPNTVVPQTSTITTGKTINYTAPAFSISVIRVRAS